MKDSIVKWQLEKDVCKADIQREGATLAKGLVDDGVENIQSAYIQAAKAKEFVESFMKGLNPYVSEEVSIENGKTAQMDNAKLAVVYSGDRLDYSKDHVVQELEAKLKARKDLLKLRTKSQGHIFDEDGDEVPMVPVKTHGSDQLRVQLL